jgi:AraC-like DNA-binding protein
MKLLSGPQILDIPLDWQAAAHVHPGVEVVGVLQGKVEAVVSDLHWRASKGEMLAIPPHVLHGWYSLGEAKVSVLHILRFPQALTNRLLPGCKPRLISLTEPQFIEHEALLSRLSALSDEATSQQVRLLRAYLEAFILFLLEEKHAPTWVAMHEVASYMQAHMQQAVAIADVARHFSLSEVTLRRRFREAFGMSPKHYLLELRLNQAQHLLTTTDFSMQEIALQMGFFDLAHFSSTFRKHYGLSPSAWRGQTQG